MPILSASVNQGKKFMSDQITYQEKNYPNWAVLAYEISISKLTSVTKMETL